MGCSIGGGFRVSRSYSLAGRSQHLAHAVSDDLLHWSDRGPLEIPPSQRWLAGRFGAPFVWRQPIDLGQPSSPPSVVADERAGHVAAQGATCFWMALMGEAELATHKSFIGLLFSSDGIHWKLLQERNFRYAPHSSKLKFVGVCEDPCYIFTP